MLNDLGLFRAVTMAAVVATLAETAQLIMAHRDPSSVDVLSNFAGAVLGVAIASYWKIRLPALPVSKGKFLLAALLAVTILVSVWATSGEAPSPRGVISPGRLEAYWKLDESSGRFTTRRSGGGLTAGSAMSRTGSMA